MSQQSTAAANSSQGSGQQPAAPAKRKSATAEFLRKFSKQKVSLVAGIFIILLVLVAIFGPYITPYDPSAPDYDALLAGPSAKHWAGTDEYGRDILSRLIEGTRLSLAVSLSAVLIAAFFLAPFSVCSPVTTASGWTG